LVQEEDTELLTTLLTVELEDEVVVWQEGDLNVKLVGLLELLPEILNPPRLVLALDAIELFQLCPDLTVTVLPETV
jgi:hypothetical protein